MNQQQEHTPESLARVARSLRRLYPQLFEATSRGQGQREKLSGRNRNDPPGPAREEVLDLIREVNAACLELEVVCKNVLGLHPQGPRDVRYRQSPRVEEALRWLERAAPALEGKQLPAEQPLEGEVGRPLLEYAGEWLQALNRQARRLLGLSGGIIPLGVPCPVVVEGQPCTGELRGLPQAGLVVCDTCEGRWHHTDWEGLGATVQVLARERAASAA